jgi:hypothetical protein
LWEIIQRGCFGKACESLQTSFLVKEEGVQFEVEQDCELRAAKTCEIRINKRKIAAEVTDTGNID